MFKSLYSWWFNQQRRFKAWLIPIRRLIWFRMRLHGNKFYSSLKLDAGRRFHMTPVEQNAYDLELIRRRRLALELDLQNEDRAREKRPANTQT
ncbi:MAG: hypothetical protein Q7S57_05425 [bacterium]|nr:hypothetical protein [bacterium]